MPKNWKDWLIVFVLGYLAISAVSAAVSTTKDPFPEGTRANQKLERTTQELKEAYEDLHKK